MIAVISLWTFAGSLAGMLQAWSLWLDANRLQSRRFFAPLRLLGIGVLLFMSAIYGGIMPAVMGWICGFLFSGAWILARSQA